MNFEDEDYRRLYVRRTVTSKRLGWEGRAVRNEMLTEFDRAGVWEFTEDASQDISDLVDLPLPIVQAGLSKLLATKTWIMTDDRIVWPNYVPAQTCPRSDRLRQQEARERRRDEALSKAKPAELPSGVTNRHAPSRESRTVTPPSRSLQIFTEQSERDARAQGSVPEVPGLSVVGALPPSQREQELSAEADALNASTLPRHEYTPGWSPTKANAAEGKMLGLTEAEIWERWDDCKNKYYQAKFRSDEKQFNRELAWAVKDKTTKTFKTRAERDAFEMPGRERRA